MKSLHTWLSEQPGRATQLAARLRVSQVFVSLMATGKKSIPTDHMAAIEVFTAGAVTRQEMCPDAEKLAYHWPELAGYQQNQPSAHAQQAQAAINSENIGA